jgi:hypothetical protein
MRLSTHNTTRMPREISALPEEFRTVVEATPVISVSPMSDWHVPHHMHDGDYRVFTVGDVNGPVRPVTTSGANLAVMEGLSVNHLVGADPYTVLSAGTDILARREYDLELGKILEGPEIGGTAEDVDYYQHHVALFPGDVS